MTISIIQLAIIILAAYAMGWLCAVSSGAVFAYIVFRTKKEQHERLFPKRPKSRETPFVIDEFAADIEPEKEDEGGLPDIIKKQNERMAQSIRLNALKKREGVENG